MRRKRGRKEGLPVYDGVKIALGIIFFREYKIELEEQS